MLDRSRCKVVALPLMSNPKMGVSWPFWAMMAALAAVLVAVLTTGWKGPLLPLQDIAMVLGGGAVGMLYGAVKALEKICGQLRDSQDQAREQHRELLTELNRIQQRAESATKSVGSW